MTVAMCVRCGSTSSEDILRDINKDSHFICLVCDQEFGHWFDVDQALEDAWEKNR